MIIIRSALQSTQLFPLLV